MTQHNWVVTVGQNDDPSGYGRFVVSAETRAEAIAEALRRSNATERNGEN